MNELVFLLASFGVFAIALALVLASSRVTRAVFLETVFHPFTDSRVEISDGKVCVTRGRPTSKSAVSDPEEASVNNNGGKKTYKMNRVGEAAPAAAKDMERPDVAQGIEEFKAYSRRQGRTLGDLTPRDLIEEGRRF